MNRGLSVILGVGNHHRVRGVLTALREPGDLAFYDRAVEDQIRSWLRLSQKHLTVAYGLQQADWADWRSVVSRAYYAAYNASRAVRYWVEGTYEPSGKDHQRASDLPDDFPNRAHWGYFLTELRDDRNKADYEPDANTFRALARSPAETVAKARDFLRAVNRYLAGRGLAL